jgi:hypothetical protein
MDFETVSAFCRICGRDAERSADVVAGLLAMPERLAAAHEAAREAPGDGWSPRAVLAHLADTEVFRGWRIRRILAEPEPLIESFDEDAWARIFHYEERELATSLATFSVNRLSNLELIRLAGAPALERNYRHAQRGILTLSDLVHHTSDHDLAHLKQITGD